MIKCMNLKVMPFAVNCTARLSSILMHILGIKNFHLEMRHSRHKPERLEWTTRIRTEQRRKGNNIIFQSLHFCIDFCPSLWVLLLAVGIHTNAGQKTQFKKP